MLSPIRSIAAGAVMMALPAYGPAFAQDQTAAVTTPEAFFAEFQGVMSSMGYGLTVESQTMDGETLVLTGVTYTLSNEQMQGTVGAGDWTIAPIDEDGYSLEMKMGEALDIDIEFSDPALAEMPPMNFTYAFVGNRTLIGGTPENRTFKTTVDTVSLDLSNFLPEDVDAEIDMVMAITNMEAVGEFATDADGNGSYSYNGSAATMVLDYAIAERRNRAVFDAAYTGLTFTAEGPFVDFSDPTVLYASQTPTVIAFDYDQSILQFEITERDETLKIDMTTGEGEVGASLGQSSLGYTIGFTDLALKVGGNVMPFPEADGSANELKIDILFPVLPTEQSVPVATEIRVIDLVLSEAIWGMFDPAQVLPRDPATIIVDASGMAQSFVNIMDPMSGPPPAGGMPFQLDSIEIDQILMSMVGAEIEAAGSAVMNNQPDMPFPMPVGSVDVSLKGVVGLVGKLSQMGMVPPNVPQMVPAMLGIYATPGSEPDTFTTKIEFTEAGAVLINGQPLQ